MRISSPFGAAAWMIGSASFSRIDDGERRRAGLLEDRQVARAFAVDAHDVLLDREAVVDVRDVAEPHDRAVGELRAECRHLRDLQRAVVRGTSYSVLPIRIVPAGVMMFCDEHRVHDGLRRLATRGHRVGVDVDHHLPLLAAVRRRRREAGDREQPHADEVERVVEDLLLAQRVATTASSARPARSTR